MCLTKTFMLVQSFSLHYWSVEVVSLSLISCFLIFVSKLHIHIFNTHIRGPYYNHFHTIYLLRIQKQLETIVMRGNRPLIKLYSVFVLRQTNAYRVASYVDVLASNTFPCELNSYHGYALNSINCNTILKSLQIISLSNVESKLRIKYQRCLHVGKRYVF